jgi:hypothetical protein
MADLNKIIHDGGFQIVGTGTWKTVIIQEGLTTQSQIHLQIVYLQSALRTCVARQILADDGYDWDLTDV